MKKFQLTFAVAACLAAAVGVYANSSVVTTYYKDSVANRTGAHCIDVINTPVCQTGTQCARKFAVNGTPTLFYLSVATTFDDLGNPTNCAILPGDIEL